MDELKKKTVDIITKLNTDWTTSIKEGEEKEGIDLSEMFSRFSEHMKELDLAFNEAKVRVYGKKRGGFW